MTSVAVGKLGSAVYLPGTAVGPRTMTEFQLVWILRGSAHWRCDGQTREVSPGQLVLVRPGMRDRWQWDRGQPTTHGYAYFRLSGQWPRETSGTWPLTRVAGEDDPVPSMLRYLLRLDVTSRADLATAAELVRFVLVLFARDPVSPLERALPTAVTAVVDHLHGAWGPTGVARAVSLDELSAAAGVSSGHLSRVFRRRFGVGPVTVTELLRLARAATLLTQSDLPIVAIARSCGFADPEHFSHRFRRVYQIPPGRYRLAADAPDPSAPIAAAGLMPIAARLLTQA